jgi:sugar phosphate isomerase/epimerase
LGRQRFDSSIKLTEEDGVQRRLGLHHLTLKELDPFDFVEVAGASGYDQVSLFTHIPHVPHAGRENMFAFPTVTAETKREMLQRLDASGLVVVGAEFFLMTSDADLSSYVAGLALGRELGAVHAVTHIFDLDRVRAVETLGTFADLAAAQGLKVCIEFCQLTPGCPSIHDAAWFVEQVGRAHVGVNICPLHLIRSGGTAADMASLDAHYFANGQINDGIGLHKSSDYFAEVHDRELPGRGDFPLLEILGALPDVTPIEVKIPSDRRKTGGPSALEFARDAAARSRALIGALQPGR